MTAEVYALPPAVRAWADEVECGSGEEGERTWRPTDVDPDVGEPEGTVQVWAERPSDVSGGEDVIGLWMSGPTVRGALTEIRVNVTPARALELAADIIAAVMVAEDKATWD